ncbi:hypothetical protein MtrunA17_Chr5g0399761 [Medicago truncatula]|uniref:Uncharacterized protein n=1 Tax=Medicago truncatula TaxID=3880 RepID=A0A396HKC8_MEDTR|nr:hypothetical protein MtrunA17_Chr5g0399761 [Medicago truncatula]
MIVEVKRAACLMCWLTHNLQHTSIHIILFIPMNSLNKLTISQTWPNHLLLHSPPLLILQFSHQTNMVESHTQTHFTNKRKISSCNFKDTKKNNTSSLSSKEIVSDSDLDFIFFF